MPFDRRDLLFGLVVVVVALAVNLGHVASTRFHRDEARWIHRSQFAAELADPFGEYWRDRDLLQGQPPLGSYLMGLGLAAQGRGLQPNQFWNFNFGDRWNERHGAMPAKADLVAARRTNSVIGALIALCAYGIGRRLAGRVAGSIAALMLIFHPLSIYLSSLAGSDALLTLMIAVAALLAIGVAARPSWLGVVLLGSVLGLGASAKLSPLLLALPLAGLGALLVARGWRAGGEEGARDLALGWKLLPLPAIGAAAFVASYPYLWPDPIGRTVTLFTFRAQEMVSQGTIWSELNVAGPADALSRVGNWLGETRSTTGSLAGWLAGRLGGGWEPAGVDLLLALVGVLVFVALVVRAGLRSPAMLAAVVLGGQTAIIVLGMRADFERYLYPVLLMVAVCVGLAADRAVAAARRFAVAVWSARRSRQGARAEVAAEGGHVVDSPARPLGA